MISTDIKITFAFRFLSNDKMKAPFRACQRAVVTTSNGPNEDVKWT